MSWDEIAIKHWTDKGSTFKHDNGVIVDGHGYAKYYEARLGPNRIFNVLEIGVLRGASLRFWAEVFPAAKIYGIDIDESCLKYATDRIQITIADAGNALHMNHYASHAPVFDLIVDDGSHNGNDIEIALKCLWGNLKAGGLYAIEDIGCENYMFPGLWTGWPAMIRDWCSHNNGTISALPSKPHTDMIGGVAVFFIDKAVRRV